MDQYLYECKCILKNWDEEVVKEEEDNYFDINKYVKISDFPNELKTNYRWNEAVKLSVHNFEYFKKVLLHIEYGNAEKILHQFCLDLVFFI